MPITKEQLIEELGSLQQQKQIFLKARSEIDLRITRTDGAIEMTTVFIQRLDEAEKQDAAEKKAAEAKAAETDPPKGEDMPVLETQKKPKKAA